MTTNVKVIKLSRFTEEMMKLGFAWDFQFNLRGNMEVENNISRLKTLNHYMTEKNRISFKRPNKENYCDSLCNQRVVAGEVLSKNERPNYIKKCRNMLDSTRRKLLQRRLSLCKYNVPHRFSVGDASEARNPIKLLNLLKSEGIRLGKRKSEPRFSKIEFYPGQVHRDSINIIPKSKSIDMLSSEQRQTIKKRLQIKPNLRNENIVTTKDIEIKKTQDIVLATINLGTINTQTITNVTPKMPHLFMRKRQTRTELKWFDKRRPLALNQYYRENYTVNAKKHKDADCLTQGVYHCTLSDICPNQKELQITTTSKFLKKTRMSFKPRILKNRKGPFISQRRYSDILPFLKKLTEEDQFHNFNACKILN